MKKLKDKISGFALLEMILAVSIASILLAAIYSGFHMGLTVYQRVNNNINLEAQTILDQLSRQLRSAYLISDDESPLAFEGGGNSLKFVTVVSLRNLIDNASEYDLKEVSYKLHSKQGGVFSLKYYFSDYSSDEKANEQNIELSQRVKLLKFKYYDGEGWGDGWNSKIDLPQAVQITIEFRANARSQETETFSTIVDMAV